MKCIIISAGDCTVKHIPVEKGDLVIAADGGVKHCERLGITPDLYLGDFDSVSNIKQQEIAALGEKEPGKVILLPCAKDDTDTLAALREGQKRGYREFEIYGALGGRLDHTLANLQCLLWISGEGCSACILEEGVRVEVIRNKEKHFSEKEQGVLSVFSLGEPAEDVDIQGLKYEMKKGCITASFPIGISNEFVGKPARIRVGKGALLLIRYLAT